MSYGYTAFDDIAMRSYLSARTVRNAFLGRPITNKTAQKIAKVTGCELKAFNLKRDNRGIRKE